MEVLMSGQHFRFLHAGGFLLDQPLSGLVEIPEPLTELLIDAPFSAAQKVFDAAVEEQVVDYWALGGQNQRQTMGSAQRVIHYAGSPQGRSPDEPGPHGATLVHISGEREIRTQFMPTDAIRWHTERLAIEDEATLDSVRKLLIDRVKQLKAEADARP